MVWVGLGLGRPPAGWPQSALNCTILAAAAARPAWAQPRGLIQPKGGLFGSNAPADSSTFPGDSHLETAEMEPAAQPADSCDLTVQGPMRKRAKFSSPHGFGLHAGRQASCGGSCANPTQRAEEEEEEEEGDEAIGPHNPLPTQLAPVSTHIAGGGWAAAPPAHIEGIHAKRKAPALEQPANKLPRLQVCWARPGAAAPSAPTAS